MNDTEVMPCPARPLHTFSPPMPLVSFASHRCVDTLNRFVLRALLAGRPLRMRSFDAVRVRMPGGVFLRRRADRRGVCKWCTDAAFCTIRAFRLQNALMNALLRSRGVRGEHMRGAVWSPAARSCYDN